MDEEKEKVASHAHIHTDAAAGDTSNVTEAAGAKSNLMQIIKARVGNGFH